MAFAGGFFAFAGFRGATFFFATLRFAFFAPGHDARVWLSGWHPEVDESQFAAGRATRAS